MSEEELSNIHCNTCDNKTEHLLIAKRHHTDSEKVDHEITIYWDTFNDVFECRGCKEVTLRRRFFFSEWNHDDVEETYYPPRIGRRLPAWKDKLDKNQTALLEEVYTALQAGSMRVSMMGARALIDMVMVEKVGDTGNFQQKLNALVKADYLSGRNRDVLDAALDVGSAAAHRGYLPKTDHVHTVMDIVENLLEAIILEEEAKELKKETPKRKKKAKPKSV